MRRSPATPRTIADRNGRLVRILRSDAAAASEARIKGALVLDRNLLGDHASRDPDEAPILTWDGREVRVDVRKKDRFVFGMPGRAFDDLPGHPGLFGRYWTWVAHPDLDETLALMHTSPPRDASGIEGILRLYRIRARLLRGDADHPLRMAAPCVIVAGLGAVEVSSLYPTDKLFWLDPGLPWPANPLTWVTDQEQDSVVVPGDPDPAEVD
jgi:hypothetical protein